MNRYSQRFQDLVNQATALEATKRSYNSGYGSGVEVDNQLYIGWKVKAKNLLEKACGPDSHHLKDFIEIENGSWDNLYEKTLKLKAIVEAAQEDYNGGYLAEAREIVRAELCDSELDQAKELLTNGFKVPAAVMTGVVLEIKLKEMCVRLGKPTGKLNKMNEDLHKLNAYSLLVQKQITAMAQIRNDAAHGNMSAFTEADVDAMISDVRRFLIQHP